MAVSLIGEAAVRLRPDTSGFSTQAEVGILGPLSEVAKKGAALFGVAWGAEKTFDYLKDSVKAYSDTTEATTRAQTVFGSSFEEVQKFAEGAATSMGQSTSQAIGAASTFGNLFRSMGIIPKTSADMSTSFVRLASDMASFNNVPIDQALTALQSGVTGMTRPLKQFGVNISQAQIQTEAATLGFSKQGKTFSSAAIAQASYALIMKQTSLTQGDFARTSHNLADQQRIIAAESENLKDKVGSALYPIVDLGARGISGVLLPALIKLATPLEEVGKKFGETSAEIGNVFRAALNGTAISVDDWQSAVGAAFGTFVASTRDDWTTFTDAAKGGGLGLLATEPSVAGFLARFGSGLHGLSIQAEGTWRSIAQTAAPHLAVLGNEISPALAPVRTALASVFTGSALAGSGTGFLGFLSGILGKIAPLVNDVIGKVGPTLERLMPVIGSALAGIVPVISGVFTQIGPVIRSVLPVIMQVAGITSTLFRTALVALLPVIPPLVTTLGQLVTTLVGGLGPILTSLAPLISTVIGVFVGEFRTVIASLVPIIPPLVSALAQVAQVIAGALLSVLSALMPVMPVVAQALGSIARAIGGALMTAITALAPLLPTLINLFMGLIQAALVPLLPLLPVIASLIPPLIGVIVALVQAAAPFLPLIVRVVATLIQLAVVAIQPLMPIIALLAGVLVVLVRALVPVITLGAQLLAVFLRVAGGMVGAVVGAVSTVIGWFQHLLAALSGIGGSISRFLGGIFDGLGGAASAAFGAVTGAVRWAINGLIGIVNGAIGFINRDLIGTINKVPGVSIPSIPSIPKLHEGGVFDSGTAAGEGLALLRDSELVVTPEQRASADDLLRELLSGNLPTPPTSPAATTGQPGVQITTHITQLPGEDGAVLAARTTQSVVWNLNSGITRRVGAGAGAP